MTQRHEQVGPNGRDNTTPLSQSEEQQGSERSIQVTRDSNVKRMNNSLADHIPSSEKLKIIALLDEGIRDMEKAIHTEAVTKHCDQRLSVIIHTGLNDILNVTRADFVLRDQGPSHNMPIDVLPSVHDARDKPSGTRSGTCNSNSEQKTTSHSRHPWPRVYRPVPGY